MAKSTLKATSKGVIPAIPALEPSPTVTVSITLDKNQFNKLTALKRKYGLLSEQDVIRFFIAKGIENVQL